MESAKNTGRNCWTNTSEDIIDTGTAAGIYDLRRLKFKHCAELVREARSVLDCCRSITPNVHPAMIAERLLIILAFTLLTDYDCFYKIKLEQH